MLLNFRRLALLSFFSLSVFILSLPASTPASAQAQCGEGMALQGGVCIPTNTGLPSASLTSILQNLMLWLLGIFGVLAIIAFIISGIQYLTAAGNSSQAETAKKNMVYSIIGVLVALSGLVIIKAVQAILTANPGTNGPVY